MVLIGQPQVPVIFSSGKVASVLIRYGAGWAFWILCRRDKFLASTGNRPQILGHPDCNVVTVPN